MNARRATSRRPASAVRRIVPAAVLLSLATGLPAGSALAQGTPPALFITGRQPVAPPAGKAGARADFTGYWTAVISEDWRWRMVTPLKGDFANIPLDAKGQAIGATWDPAKDEAAGEQCRGYAAPGVMRLPEHLHIYWKDDQTLVIDIDTGMQTRVLHFDAAAARGEPLGWQGQSVAHWEGPVPQPYPGIGLGLYPRGNTQSKALMVTTSNIRPGYLRKNGIPFSASTRMTEYYDRYRDPDGSEWILVTTIVEDPVYLNAPWVTTTTFKRLKDGSLWHPTPCSAR